MPMRTLRRAALLLSLPALAACGARQQAPADLAVTRVVLYQSGVAYLERAGRVNGEELVMPIRADQINDILATLVIVDRGSDGAASVSLPIDESASDRLSDLPPELRNAGGLVAILHAFRGAEVNVRATDGSTRGRVVGVETIDSEPHVTILTPRDEMVPIAISDIDDVDLQSGSLSTGLRRSLDHSLAEGEWKPTDVTVRFSEAGGHDVVMAYVVEMPIWKPAYRVVVDDDDLFLQGWAVIDNTSGVDWTDVRLSLTAGSPISFRYNLHSPVYVDRPDMSGYGAPNIANLRPPTPVVAAARRSRASSRPQQPGASATMVDSRSAEMEMAVAQHGRDEELDETGEWEDYDGIGVGDFEQSMHGQSVTAEDVGAVVRFDVPGRVTLPDQTSTMVTLVNSQIAGDDALIFQPDSAPASHQHPYRALLLDNSTPYPIQRAPIAIYNGSTFVGQGITPLIAPDQSAVVPYALENRVRVAQRSSNQSGEVSLVRIVDGTVYTEVEQIQGVTFEVRSALAEAQTAYFKVVRYGGWDLVAGDFDEEEVQTEAGFYLVPFELEGGDDTEFTVNQRSRVSSTINVFDPRAKQMFAAYLTGPDVRPDVAARLEPIVDMLEEKSDNESQLAARRRLQNDVQVRTNELRASIRTLGDSATNRDLRETLVDRLAEQDDTLDRLTGEIVEISERNSLLQVMVTEALREITLEPVE